MQRALFFSDPVIGPIIQVYFFLVGLIIGSFLNVCIYRVPLHKSIVTPRSGCPQCGTIIRWYHNIPLLSYLLLRGRCANCGARISPVYPLIELITGLLFLFLYREFGISIPFFIYAVFGCITIVLICIDYYHRLLPAVITLPGLAIGVLTSFVNPFITPKDSLLGILVGGILPIAAMWIYKLVRKREGLGHGDIVMLAMVGAFLGWQQVLLVLFFSSLIGSIIGGLIIVVFRKGSDFMLPYGTFIGATAIPAIFWGPYIWSHFVLP
jgi:leader peptidase (prepilin peptidase)/N-methyltransferase